MNNTKFHCDILERKSDIIYTSVADIPVKLPAIKSPYWSILLDCLFNVDIILTVDLILSLLFTVCMHHLILGQVFLICVQRCNIYKFIIFINTPKKRKNKQTHTHNCKIQLQPVSNHVLVFVILISYNRITNWNEM